MIIKDIHLDMEGFLEDYDMDFSLFINWGETKQ